MQIHKRCKIRYISTYAFHFPCKSREPLSREQSLGGLHWRNAGMHLWIGATYHSPHLKKALLHCDPCHSWPLEGTAGRWTNISPPNWNENMHNMSNMLNIAGGGESYVSNNRWVIVMPRSAGDLQLPKPDEKLWSEKFPSAQQAFQTSRDTQQP